MKQNGRKGRFDHSPITCVVPRHILQESLANAKVNARQHCVTLSCLCNSLTQIEWVADFSLGDEDSDNIASERYENRHLRRPLSCLTPHICEYLHNPYIARKHIQRTTFPSLTVWVYLHSNFCGGPKHAKSREIPREFDLIAVQGHPRSSILVSIESPYVTSY